MFQAYGKKLWRVSGFTLLIGLLTVFSVAAFALFLPASNQTVTSSSSISAEEKSGGSISLPEYLNGTKTAQWYSNSDGSYRIQTLIQSSSDTDKPAKQVKPVLMGIEREQLALSPNAGHYITLNSPGDFFVLPGAIQRVIPDNRQMKNLIEIGHIGKKHVLQALSPGYYRIETDGSAPGDPWFHLFVSPIPSYHLDRTDRNWYLTQFNTETTSNCGPTVAAMAVRWASDAKPEVLDIRQYLGWNGDGAVSMEELKEALDTYSIKSKLMNLRSPNDIFAALERGHLVAVVYNMAGLQAITHPEFNLMGQYYNDQGGHYLALKGYSLDHKWFIVYDPIPSDWAENRLRYPDGITMIGRNRYYDVNQLFNALRSNQALEIIR